jgi:hypothetical protein
MSTDWRDELIQGQVVAVRIACRARLEAETGAWLVQRIGRGIRLTPEGEHLARRAVEIIGRVDTAAEELSAMVGL